MHCFYADEGSAFITVQNNVCDSAPMWLTFNAPGHDLSVLNMYTNVQRMRIGSAGIKIGNTTYASGQDWPVGAQSILDHAGLEPDYEHLFHWLENTKSP